MVIGSSGETGKAGKVYALYIKEGLHCTVIAVGDNIVENLWAKIRGKTNNADVVVGVFYRSSRQDDDTDIVLYMELREISRSVVLVLIGDFNFLDVSQDCHTADTNRSSKFMKHIEDNFLMQVLREPTRKNAFQDLFFENKDGLVGK